MAIMRYSTEITLYNSYFDMNDQLSAKAILNIFQDVAAHHADFIGLGYEKMLKKNLYWVLSRIKYDILKQPKPNQRVVVETWPHEKGKIDFDRDMRIMSEDGEILVLASSKWCVIDTESRSLQRTENVDYNGEIYPEINYPEKFAKIRFVQDDAVVVFDYKVKYSDLDHNKHMNNTNYATLVLNAVNNKNFAHFEINFNSECVYGDEIEIKRVLAEDAEIVIGENGGKVAFVAMVK